MRSNRTGRTKKAVEQSRAFFVYGDGARKKTMKTRIARRIIKRSSEAVAFMRLKKHRARAAPETAGENKLTFSPAADIMDTTNE